jgi:hypothetical protein
MCEVYARLVFKKVELLSSTVCFKSARFPVFLGTKARPVGTNEGEDDDSRMRD